MRTQLEASNLRQLGRWLFSGFVIVSSIAGLAAVYSPTDASKIVSTAAVLYFPAALAIWVWQELKVERLHLEQHSDRRTAEQEHADEVSRILAGEPDWRDTMPPAGAWHAYLEFGYGSDYPERLVVENEMGLIYAEFVAYYDDGRPPYLFPALERQIWAYDNEHWLPESILVEWYDPSGFHCKFIRAERRPSL